MMSGEQRGDRRRDARRRVAWSAGGGVGGVGGISRAEHSTSGDLCGGWARRGERATKHQNERGGEKREKPVERTHASLPASQRCYIIPSLSHHRPDF